MNTLKKLFDLAIELRNSASNEGCEADLTVVDAAKLWDLLQYVSLLKAEGENAAARAEEGIRFMDELLASVETLTSVVDEHGSRTLVDLMYLHSAIHKGSCIDHYPNESKVLEIVQNLPSGKRWASFVDVVQPANDVEQDEVAAILNGSATGGEFEGHDWAIGRYCEDGYPVFVDDCQLSYRKTEKSAKMYALEIIARINADGGYRLYNRPKGFLPPMLPANAS